MNLEEIKKVVNSSMPDTIKEQQIIGILSSDKKVIPMMMRILDQERTGNKELITDMNLELSRAHIYIDLRPEVKSESKDSFSKNFVIDEIAKFYIKYKPRVTHCFNRFI